MKRTLYLNKSHLTAIARSRASAPLRSLELLSPEGGRTFKQILDYGCGRGDDVRIMKECGLNATGYDPHFFPQKPRGIYDMILCTYVLNVIPDGAERNKVISDMQTMLRDDGIIALSVRNDCEKLTGYRKNGTWQGFIMIVGYTYRVRNRGFTTYFIHKDNDCTTASVTTT